MIVGADGADDHAILASADGLYGRFGMRRVYYSAFSPIPDSSSALPPSRPPLLREHRLYQADWMLRFYGFALDEIRAAAPGGHLPLEMDPKQAWALMNRHLFPLDVNRAPKEMLLRVPGLGPKVVGRILAARRWRQLRLADVERLVASPRRVRPFLEMPDWRPSGPGDLQRASVGVAAPAQFELFGAAA
jgi:predicted DNA-binding helix-hairpin-helix protein